MTAATPGKDGTPRVSDRVDEILSAVLTSRGEKEDGTHDHLPRVLRDFLHESCGKAHLLGFDDGYAEGFGKAEECAKITIADLERQLVEARAERDGWCDNAWTARQHWTGEELRADRAEATLAEAQAERANIQKFLGSVWRWCNRPNVTDAERVSFIRYHPTLAKMVEPHDDAYRGSTDQAGRDGGVTEALAAGLAVSGCGFTVGEKHVFCDDPQAPRVGPTQDCACRRMMTAALAAQPRHDTRTYREGLLAAAEIAESWASGLNTHDQHKACNAIAIEIRAAADREGE